MEQCTTTVISAFKASTAYPDVCSFVQDVCADQTSTVDFFSFYYCTLDQNLPILLVFGVCFLILSFYLLSSTAEDYLEPTLTTIAEKLHFSESLAGVTLVALANGAPDVFAAFAAGGGSDSDILLPLGALFGAGCFVSTVVLAVCVLFSKEGSIQAEPTALTRDCFFYFLAAAWVLYQGIQGTLTYGGAIGLFVIYLIFILVVVGQEIMINKKKKKKQQEEDEERRKKPSFMISIDMVERPAQDASVDENNNSKLMLSLIKEEHIPSTLSDLDSSISVNTPGLKKMNSVSSNDDSMIMTSNANPSNPRTLKRAGSHSSIVKAKFRYEYLRHKAYNELKEIHQKNAFGRIISYVAIPFNIARNLTIPPSTQDRWNKHLLIVQPFFSSIFCLWQFGYLDKLENNALYWAIFLTIALICSAVLYKLTRSYEVPQGAGGFVLIAIAFIAAGVWINLIANVFVDFINLISFFTNLPSNYLGLTLLAWGNSVNDLFVDSSLAKKGLGQVAVSGVFAGQFFNLAVGFGATIVRQIHQFGPLPFDLLEHSHISLVSLILICCLLLSLLSTLLYGVISKYHLKKMYGVYLGVIYAVFFIVSTLLIVVFKN